MLPTRTITIFAREPHQLFQFYPALSGGSGEILLKKKKSVTTDDIGDASIDLPIGHWTCVPPSDFADGETFEFDLVEGADISLDALLEAGLIGTPPYKYIDGKIEELKDEEDPFEQYLNEERGDERYYTKTQSDERYVNAESWETALDELNFALVEKADLSGAAFTGNLAIGGDAYVDPRVRLLVRNETPGGFTAQIFKAHDDSLDINFQSGINVLHSWQYGNTPMYGRTYQVYAAGGVHGLILGCNDYVGATVPYLPNAASIPNGFIRFEVGPIAPYSIAMQIQNKGDILFGFITERKSLTSQQNDTSVLSDQANFTEADIGKFIWWGDYELGGRVSVCDRITGVINGLYCEAETSRSISTQPMRIGVPRAIITHDGKFGVGISLPTESIHTAGNAIVEGNLAVNGSLNGANATLSGALVSATIAIGAASAQYPLEVRGAANSFAASFGRTLSNGQWSAIHFGYAENGFNTYRKSAIAFECTDAANARGTIHFLNNNAATNANADLTDSVMSIDRNGNIFAPKGDVEIVTEAKGLIQKTEETATRRRLVFHDNGTVTCAAVL